MQEVTNVQRLSKRVAGLKPSGIRKFFDIAATMKDVISLGIGEPDFTTPKPILEAGIRSLQNGETHYTSNWGKLELRQAIAILAHGGFSRSGEFSRDRWVRHPVRL